MIHDKLKLTLPWDEIEEGAQKQIKDTLRMPSLEMLAIMPDVHQGYDLPIGGVALLRDYIWPGATGYDIGCGMIHYNTKLPLDIFSDMEVVYDRLADLIPVGFSKQKYPYELNTLFTNAAGDENLKSIVDNKAGWQLGTLGGGNHFIEIGVNDRDEVGITIHSGSRGAGWAIGDYYMKRCDGPIPVTSILGKAYVEDMKWALDYALDNRKLMMIQCCKALELRDFNYLEWVNENHNHAEVNIDGTVLYRKGATPAEEGKLGIIPANMRDGVWITKGLGNEEFLCSASHGAGRKLSRTKARETVDTVEFFEDMIGVITPSLDKLTDESPHAYKDITDVLNRQDGLLVDVIDHFKPLLVLKG
jgi:tRNA-splicing ligase RtcB (3'-phosphate/5'-hydroxy nucleic acid ligase)